MQTNLRKALAVTGLVLVLGLAAFLRLYRVSWDRGYLFHPDERQILFVTDQVSLAWPQDPALLLTPQSPWNPKFFAYGSFPIYLLRACADLAGMFDEAFASLDGSYIVGRVLSALFDLGTVYLIYRLGCKLYDLPIGLLAATLVSLAVLHIQLAHFYAVDTPLTFFVVLTASLSVDLVRSPTIKRGAVVGVVWGMALVTKISAAPLLLAIVIAWLFGAGAQTRERPPQEPRKVHRWTVLGRAILGSGVSAFAALLTFLVLEPYALIDPATFLTDLITESYMARGLADIPYTRQFLGTLPYVYLIAQTTVWSLGIPLGIAAFAAVPVAAGRALSALRRGQWRRAGELLVPLSWVGGYFGVIGSFHAKFLRYMLPLVPFLCLWASWALVAWVRGRERGGIVRAVGVAAVVVVLGGSALYAFAFLNVYRQDHPWIQATAWICDQVPKPSRILVEHWDDPLPLMQGGGVLGCYRSHFIDVFSGYDPDDTAKLDDLLAALERDDYIVLSTNRLYNTIPRLPQRYPLSSRYYELLLSERLGYELVYYVSVYPELFGVRLVNDTFSNPDLPVPRLLAEGEAAHAFINLGRADESFTVYDHPKPLIFKKTQDLTREGLLQLFGDAARGLPEPNMED